MIKEIVDSSWYRKYRSWILLLADLGIVVFAYLLALLVDLNIGFLPFVRDYTKVTCLYLIGAMVSYGFFFVLFRIHRSIWTYLGNRELLNICVADLLGSLVMQLPFIASSKATVKPVRFGVISYLLIVAMMMFIRIIYRLLRDRELLKQTQGEIKNALIIGICDEGFVLLKEISKTRVFGANVVGFVDESDQQITVGGTKTLGAISDLPKLVRQYDVKLIFLVRPDLTQTQKKFILELAEARQIQLKILRPGVERLTDKRSITNQVEDIDITELLGRGEIKLDQAEIASYLSGKTVLVTGAGGSIGSQLVREIIKQMPSRLLLVDINENALYMLEQEIFALKRQHPVFSCIDVLGLIVSIRDINSLSAVLAKHKPHVVFHAAAHKHVPLMENRPQEAIKNNVFGTGNLINAAVAAKVGHFIMISTDKAVNPTSVMGATKRMTELLVQAAPLKPDCRTKFAAVRFGNVLGSNGSVIPIFKEQIKKGGPITITDFNIVRYFMTIPEAAQLVLQAGYYASSGDIFVLDMGEPVKILTLAEKMIRLTGLVPYSDIEIKEIGLRPGEKMYEELALADESRTRTKNDLIFQNEHITVDVAQLDRTLAELKEMAYDESVAKEHIRERLLHLATLDYVSLPQSKES